MKKRIWELDALRGLCVIGMVAVHLVYDLAVMYRVVSGICQNGFCWCKTGAACCFC